MAESKGCQINLDKQDKNDNIPGRILPETRLIDDFRAPCSFMEIVFECDNKLVLGSDNEYYITYHGIDWVPFTMHESRTVNKTWHYDMGCYPRHMFDKITKPVSNTMELAMSMKLQLTNISESLPVPCPIINEYAGDLIQNIRLHSLEQAYLKDRLGDAAYIYFSSKELMSMRWHTIMNQTAVQINFPEELNGSNLVTYMDDQFESLFTTPQGADPWIQNDYLTKMLGPGFKIQTATPALFMNVYTMSFKDVPEFDTGLPYLCVYTERDVTNPNAYTHIFVSMKYV